MNRLKRLFRRKSKPVHDWKASIPPPLKPGFDILGRQAGQKRNRVHIYRQPFGYPIRLCDWVLQDKADIEEVGFCQGIGGPAEMITLVTALDWRENAGDRICRHCKATAAGKRTSIGMAYHGHGKGAPL